MHTAIFTPDETAASLTIERRFDAPRTKVWAAHTQSALLEQWWAPLPWKAVTKTHDFREGGHWHYYMAGPNGEQEWCFVSYSNIQPEIEFSGDDYFCDEEGNKNDAMPSMHWKTEFLEEDGGTKIISTITLPSKEDLQKLLSMGMQEGYTMALNQLDSLLGT